ncbi:GFA family protein [Pelagovum pacificum]|uniref:GFA family protein n=1 Tax=Pelagovum pacificum TaxID=2588711 RepID=A0A5C5GFH6_9RHOB|nr:GFA family protein [Pelagovum pacificum]QQA43346.1 GFA family protein [Pelagovum pacificum]TNY33518.1 GFA family protein [Pelagovum pacificum]
MPRYHGSCHCGAVRFAVDGEITELTRCDCSLCRRKNALMGAVPEAAFEMLSDWETVALYQWNTKVARHYFCKTCGIYTFHRKRSAPDHYGFNVECLDDFDPSGVPVRQATGSTMSVEGAQARKA